MSDYHAYISKLLAACEEDLKRYDCTSPEYIGNKEEEQDGSEE